MKVCKGYVRNRNHPESCIAKCYIAEEAIKFLAENFFDDKTAGIPIAATQSPSQHQVLWLLVFMARNLTKLIFACFKIWMNS